MKDLEKLLEEIYSEKENFINYGRGIKGFSHSGKNKKQNEKVLYREIRKNLYPTNNNKKINSAAFSYLLEYPCIGPMELCKRQEIRENTSKINQVTNKIIREMPDKNTLFLDSTFKHLKEITDGAKIRHGLAIIQGTNYIPPKTYPEIRNELFKLQKEILDHEMDPIMKSFHLHYYFVKIHPLEDGNGRSARVLSNAYLYKNNIFPQSIHPAFRQKYINYLEKANKSREDVFDLNEITPEQKTLYHFFGKSILYSYKEGLHNLKTCKKHMTK